jgi:hypothetical protein
VSKKQQRWASDDDANDLLAGILDETEDDAKAEEERIQAQIHARDAAERRQHDAENERKRSEAEARISAETERQGHVQERRTARMEALKIEDLKARGEWIDPAILAREQAEAAARFREEEDAKIRRDAIAAAAVQSAAAFSAPIPANTNTSNTKLYASLGVVAALVLVGGGVLFAMSQGYEVDQTAYSKTVFKPKDVAVALVEKGFTPLPKAEVVVEDEPAAKSSRRSSRSSKSSSKATSKPAAKTAKTDSVGKAANAKADKLKDLLNSSSDPFGM